jgi:hypothetical protein
MQRSISATRPRVRKKLQLERLEGRQLLSTITVNTTADGTTPGAALSLRQAIEVSNGTLPLSSLTAQEQAQVSGPVGATNTIDFDIPATDPGYNAATGVWTIAVNSALPTINTNAAIINGYSQPGASKNTLAQGDNAKLTIALSGPNQAGVNGLTIGQQGSQVRGLDIENFRHAGILVTAGGNAQVAGCFIGTDPSGEKAAPDGVGIMIENANNTFGGPNVGDRNVISANSGWSGDGIYVIDQKSNPLGVLPTGNLIENNFIGLDASGTKALPNASGVEDFASGNTYGGTAPGTGNVISGNIVDGLRATGGITVEGNYIGTDARGKVALGNGNAGINDQGLYTTAMATTISGNVVSGNQNGVVVSNNAEMVFGSPGSQQGLSKFTITNNLIGTDADGTAALGNTGGGLLLGSVQNATVQNNVISANFTGISLGGPDTANNVVQGNLIGTDKTGLLPLGNLGWGIEVNDKGGLIGGTGPGQGNVIAFNTGNGISDQGSQNDRFLRNSIFGNGQVGIQFFVSNANNSVTPPVMTSTPGSGSNGTLAGTIQGSPNAAYLIEVFSNPTAPLAGQEQGKTFVQDITVNTDGTGKGTFSLTEPDGFYTATSTDPKGNTSAFSNAAGVATLPATTTAVSSSQNPSTVGQPVTFTAVVTASGLQGTPAGTVTFTIDGQEQTTVPLSVVGGVDEAQFMTSALAAGQHSVKAAYNGDENFSASSGSLPTQTVNAPNLQSTTTTLTSSSNPSTVGQPVTFMAVVAAPGFQGTPTGTVTFTIDGQAQSPVPLSVVGGVDEAQFTTSTLAAGQHSVAATYSGDANLVGSSGSLATQTVKAPNLQPTTTTLVTSLNPSAVGQKVTFTAFVSAGTSARTPTGMVTFVIDGTPQAPVPLRAVKGKDEASFSISSLTAGKHSVSATYQGDAAFAASTVSTPLAQVVDAPVGEALTVMSVKRFGVHMQPTVLVVTFSAALDPASAQDRFNYVITSPAGKRIALESAVYDRVLRTVTLRTRERISIHHGYRFEIIGTGPRGVTGADGTPLDPVGNGMPGRNYVTTLTWRNLVLTPAEIAKSVSPRRAHPAGVLRHRFVSRAH